MNNYRDILISLAIRALIASPFFYLFISGCAGLFGFFFGMIGAIIIAFPLARLFSEPSGSLYWQGGEYEKHPPPVYGIPLSKRAKGLYEEAIAGFEKIAEHYPDEVRPYVEMIDIAILKLKDLERANRIYQKGMARLIKDEDKAMLAQMYSSIRTRLNAKPSN